VVGAGRGQGERVLLDLRFGVRGRDGVEVVALLSGIIVGAIVVEGAVGRKGLVLVLHILALSVLLLEVVVTNLFLSCQDLVTDLVDVVESELEG
jgi:hypothetical protein